VLIECIGGTHKTNVRAMARDGIVLLKNTDSTLPLSKPKSIAGIALLRPRVRMLVWIVGVMMVRW
jgi:beta-glucosidase-like glycosyl hydrolase